MQNGSAGSCPPRFIAGRSSFSHAPERSSARALSTPSRKTTQGRVVRLHNIGRPQFLIFTPAPQIPNSMTLSPPSRSVGLRRGPKVDELGRTAFPHGYLSVQRVQGVRSRTIRLAQA